MMNKQGFRKYAGAVKPEDSLITESNGFDKITMLEPGTSPLAWIDVRDASYPDKQ
jgi:hypothetical protein